MRRALLAAILAAGSVVLVIFKIPSSDVDTLGVIGARDSVFSPCAPGACKDTVFVKFLGVAGFLIRNGKYSVMTAPLFTRPDLESVITKGSSHPALVARMMKTVTDSSRVLLLLAGHTHYDHFFDVPTILRADSLLPFMGSSSARRLLLGAKVPATRRLMAVDTAAATETDEGTWIDIRSEDTIPRFRVLPIVSTHAPNIPIRNFIFANRPAQSPSEPPPKTPLCWPKGEVLAYYIDVLSDSNRRVFRIYYQDSASDPDHSGLPAHAGAKMDSVDLAIIAGASFSNTPKFPETIIGSLKPKFVLVGHWESFFRPLIDPSPRLVFGLDGEELRTRLDDSVRGRWAALKALSVAKFPR